MHVDRTYSGVQKSTNKLYVKYFIFRIIPAMKADPQ
jgi:hypothetical protein